MNGLPVVSFTGLNADSLEASLVSGFEADKE